ncbi:MAG: hypothetical protein MI757_05720 [Pirellulales bacterium]|nr:hypothetical protein [Pirellulales bacterium]
MLPYGTIRYRGAPAALRDIPIGTVLHGYFVLPPEGDTSIPKPAQFMPKYTHAISLEDDFSFYERQQQVWKMMELNLGYDGYSDQLPTRNEDSDWRLTPILVGSLKVALEGKGDGNGLSGEHSFTVDRSTRLWRGRQRIDWEDLAPPEQWKHSDDWTLTLKGVTRQVNLKNVKPYVRTLKLKGVKMQVGLTWTPGWKAGRYHVADIWLDEESRGLATETQRQIHIRHMRHRWLPGWVDHVEHRAGGGGVVTITLFGRVDESLLEAVRKPAKGSISVAAGEWTLRTWRQNHDEINGTLVGLNEIESPPIGSSGLQLQVEMQELIAGFARGRIVRLRPRSFHDAELPPEERIDSVIDRIPATYKPHGLHE